MSRHWRPDRSDWTVIEGYGGGGRGSVRGAVALAIAAVVLGLIGGAAWQRWDAPVEDSGPSGPIEWNAVQPVPTRAPDSEDKEWQARADALDNAAAVAQADQNQLASKAAR